MNCIANLDVSRNDIGPSVVLDQTVRCSTLKQFNLSYNQLSFLPENLGDVVEKLEQLILEGCYAFFAFFHDKPKIISKQIYMCSGSNFKSSTVSLLF
eukprot:bmy_16371T0